MILFIQHFHQKKQDEMMTSTIPWIEKYRPQKFEHIVLDPMNRKLFQNILDKNHFPNLLFYGTPGTGKTTTVINLINEYQERYNNSAKGSVIHLNASDERGIDIIRNHINQFVKSKNLFETGCKFVVLDEVDYMTKNAQQALKYLIQTSNYNVHYCLICNYISKIDEPLQHEFICVRFNQLPKKEIRDFIKNMISKENIDLDDEVIETIQEMHKSDIRSIINFIQLNQNLSVDKNENTLHWSNSIINRKMWEQLHLLLMSPDKHEETVQFIRDVSIHHNIDKKHIVHTYFNYIIRNMKITNELLTLMENIVHSGDATNDVIVDYFSIFMRKYYAQMR